ncbi:MAG: hypothetical protein V4539_23470 [Bacteroidota bacterium]
MKRLTVLTALIFSLLISSHSRAQISVHINIGSQPAWGPEGYDYVDYYYLPDLDVYYNVPQRQFIYPEGGRWVFASSLPGRYHNYNIYNTYKVVVNEPRPYLRANVYRAKYARYKGGNGPRQVVIRDSHDQRYKNNGPRNNGHDDNGNGKNKGKGNGHDNGNGKGKGHGHG